MLIGLAGYARSGKDAAAKTLVAVGYTRVSFADKLREFLYALDPACGADWGTLATVVDCIGWETAKDQYPEVRRLLQRCGTEAGRNVLGENVWVDAVLRDLPAETVVTDVRFENEARAIVALGGRIIRVRRPGFEPINAHPSEVALDHWAFDGFVVNDGDLGDLSLSILSAVR